MYFIEMPSSMHKSVCDFKTVCLQDIVGGGGGVGFCLSIVGMIDDNTLIQFK